MRSTLVTPGGDTYPFLATELVTNAVTLRSAVQAGISADALRKAWAHAREAVNEINGLGCVCVSQQLMSCSLLLRQRCSHGSWC
jgi:hypothetical protein